MALHTLLTKQRVRFISLLLLCTLSFSAHAKKSFAFLLSAYSNSPPIIKARNGVPHAKHIDKSTDLVKGPATIPIANQATLKLPAGYGFVEDDEAQRILKHMGNHPRAGIQGLIIPLVPQNPSWIIVLEYSNQGYYKDADAKTWNPNYLLVETQIHANEAFNHAESEDDAPGVDIIDWFEKPIYNPTQQQITWAISYQNTKNSQTPIVNYNAVQLSREGYIRVSLITNTDNKLDVIKTITLNALASITLNKEKKYTAFNSSTDKLSDHSITTLIIGLPVTKPGLFETISLSFSKIIRRFGIFIFVILALYRKFYKKPEPQEENDEKDVPKTLINRRFIHKRTWRKMVAQQRALRRKQLKKKAKLKSAQNKKSVQKTRYIRIYALNLTHKILFKKKAATPPHPTALKTFNAILFNRIKLHNRPTISIDSQDSAQRYIPSPPTKLLSWFYPTLGSD